MPNPLPVHTIIHGDGLCKTHKAETNMRCSFCLAYKCGDCERCRGHEKCPRCKTKMAPSDVHEREMNWDVKILLPEGGVIQRTKRGYVCIPCSQELIAKSRGMRAPVYTESR